MSAFFLVIGCVWLLATLFIQFKSKLSEKILSYDRVVFLPLWTFFAPKPCEIDIHLLVRYQGEESCSDWTETPLTSAMNDRIIGVRSFFNPFRRVEKILFDFSNDIYHFKDHPGQIRHLTAYIFILQYVEGLVRDKGAKRVQFMLAGDNRGLGKKLEVLLISDFHLLSRVV